MRGYGRGLLTGRIATCEEAFAASFLKEIKGYMEVTSWVILDLASRFSGQVSLRASWRVRSAIAACRSAARRRRRLLPLLRKADEVRVKIRYDNGYSVDLPLNEPDLAYWKAQLY